MLEIGLLLGAIILIYEWLKPGTSLATIASSQAYPDSEIAGGNAPAPFTAPVIDPFTGGLAYWLATELSSPVTEGITNQGGGGGSILT